MKASSPCLHLLSTGIEGRYEHAQPILVWMKLKPRQAVFQVPVSVLGDRDSVIPPHDGFGFEDTFPGNGLHAGVLGHTEIA